MKFETVKDLDAEKFRRLTGVKRTHLTRLVLILREAQPREKNHGGRKNKLSLGNMWLMTREYRTYFPIRQSQGVSESPAYKSVRWVENPL